MYCSRSTFPLLISQYSESHPNTSGLTQQHQQSSNDHRRLWKQSTVSTMIYIIAVFIVIHPCYGLVAPSICYQPSQQQQQQQQHRQPLISGHHSTSQLFTTSTRNPTWTIQRMTNRWSCVNYQKRSCCGSTSRKLIVLSATSPKLSSSDNDTATTTTTATATTSRTNSTTIVDISSIDLLKSAKSDDDTLQIYNAQRHSTRSFLLYIEENVFMGIPLTFELVAIITIYFVEGALGIARLAQSYLFKDTLHLGPAELSALSGLFVLPWTLKPLYGFLSDGIPLFGYKRKSYLILCGIIGTIAYGILSYDPLWDQLSLSMSTQGTVIALMVGSACIAFSDVVADGIVVTRTREIANQELQTQLLSDDGTDDSAKTAGGLQSLCWGASAIGGLLSAYFSGSLLEIMSVRSIFGLTAVLPFLVAIIATGIDEERAPVQSQSNDDAPMAFTNGVRDQISTLWDAFQQSSIWKPTLFVFLWQSTPTSDGAFFYFLTNDLQFGPEFLGRVRFVTAGAGLLGVFLYNQYFKTIQIKNILFWSTLLSFPLGLLPVLLITHVNRELGIPDTWLIYGDDVALAVLGTIAFMPTLVLAARLCPPGIEAVLFATLMSIYNGASTVGTELGALLTKVAGITESNFDNLALLTIFCNVSSLWPLVLIGWLDEVGTLSEADIEDSNEQSTL
jgi:folate/biopterin transporter